MVKKNNKTLTHRIFNSELFCIIHEVDWNLLLSNFKISFEIRNISPLFKALIPCPALTIYYVLFVLISSFNVCIRFLRFKCFGLEHHSRYIICRNTHSVHTNYYCWCHQTHLSLGLCYFWWILREKMHLTKSAKQLQALKYGISSENGYSIQAETQLS